MKHLDKQRQHLPENNSLPCAEVPSHTLLAHMEKLVKEKKVQESHAFVGTFICLQLGGRWKCESSWERKISLLDLKIHDCRGWGHISVDRILA